ncbi:hypothetical protein ACVIW2_001002 [Bradyrhizobium huanghuaihaiense]|uniref:Uncharacterized protein n=1 Tax=Bradyrhizobium huanghuaihaiense TaxID=990078 RepID=A0A562RPH2_9BRAD|nr:hypothetical protein [Bradyrhizobium huanghuaihaiense]TWI70959.1 hypothetical protein IQ16_03373 [Bradyrhizobium huanghuaihaiense]
MDDGGLTDSSLRQAISQGLLQALPYLGIALCLAVAMWLTWSRLL